MGRKNDAEAANKKYLVLLIPIILVMGAIIIIITGNNNNNNNDNNNYNDTQAEDNGKVTLMFHYSRDDGDYDKWSLWVWEDTGDGKDFSFSVNEEEAYSYVLVDNRTLEVGYIVRTQSWEKDVTVDRFVDISGVAGGTIDVYLIQGEEDAEIKKRADVISATAKVVSAKYDGEYGITAEFTESVSASNEVKVLSTLGEEVEITSISESEDKYIINVKEPLTLAQSYCLEYKGASYTIEMPDFFSTEEFEAEYTYTGNDLGANWTEEKTVFKVWAPTADHVKLCLYESGQSGMDDLIDEFEMVKGGYGVWSVEVQGNQNGIYYTYKVKVNREEIEACDPYARATGVNGDRAMVIDLSSTNPEGWENDVNPNAGADITDTIIYEVDVRDFSIDESSGVSEQNRGKYLAFTEKGTTNAGGEVTGIDYLVSLGVTHVQIMPIQDYGYIDEREPDYNWGYGTKNYNVPEGSYSTNPYDGEVRIKETKEMIKALHDNGMSVILDVVYNHVCDASDFCFNKIVPNYFTRIDSRGVYSNGSLCGNDTASERSMVSRYIVDSVVYWVEEYHVDGFRFDLAGILDVDTINEIVRRVKEIDPDVILYGEGWNMSTVSTKFGIKFATQTNAALTEGFGYFDDRIRSRLKGKSNDNTAGYITGLSNAEEIMMSVRANAGWSDNPQQIVNYVSCHDDATLWDKIRTTAAGTHEEQVKQNNLASAIILSSQGISFLHAGDELLRTKVDEEGKIVFDSYQSPDDVNSIKWDSLSQDEIKNIKEYYQGLIAFRKAHKALRMNTTEEIGQNMEFLENLPSNVVAYVIDGTNIDGENSEKILVVYNPNHDTAELVLPEGKWSICVNGEKSGTDVIEEISGTIVLEPISVYMFIQ